MLFCLFVREALANQKRTLRQNCLQSACNCPVGALKSMCQAPPARPKGRVGLGDARRKLTPGLEPGISKGASFGASLGAFNANWVCIEIWTFLWSHPKDATVELQGVF